MRWLHAGSSIFVVSISLVEKKSADQALSGNEPAIHREASQEGKARFSVERVAGDVRTGIQ